MRSWSIDTYLGRLAARHPTPAGSAVAALNLAQAAALLMMVARFRADPGRHGHDVAQRVLGRAEELSERALRVAEADAGVVEEVAAAYALPRATEVERGRRSAAIADALLAAAGPPAELVTVGAELVGLCERIAEVASGALLGDVAAAADATAAALSISRSNIEADIGPRRGTAKAERLAAELDSINDLLRRSVRVRDEIRERFPGRAREGEGLADPAQPHRRRE